MDTGDYLSSSDSRSGELAERRDQDALSAYSKISADVKWSDTATADEFFLRVPEFDRFFAGEHRGRATRKDLVVAGGVILGMLLLLGLGNWSALRGGPGTMKTPDIAVRLFNLKKLSRPMRTKASEFNLRIGEARVEEAWGLLGGGGSDIIDAIPEGGQEEVSQARARSCEILAVLANGPLPERTARLWTEFESMDRRLSAKLGGGAASLDDEALVSLYRAQTLRQAVPLIRLGLENSIPLPSYWTCTRGSLAEIRENLGRLAPRQSEWGKNFQQIHALSEAQAALAACWVVFLPKGHPQEGGFASVSRVAIKSMPDGHGALGKVDGALQLAQEQGLRGNPEWQTVARGFWRTLNEISAFSPGSEYVRVGDMSFTKAQIAQNLHNVEKNIALYWKP